MKTVNIAKQFTRFPSGRFKKNGDTSGEAFRERFLEGSLSNGESITIELDGTIGYGSSFLEEAFGGSVRKLKIDPEIVLTLIKLKSEDPALIEEIQQYIREAGVRNQN